MAINPDDFIFHSDLVYEQSLENKSYALSTSGTIAAGAERTWASAWFDLPIANSTVRAEVTISGNVAQPTANGGRFPVPVTNIYDSANNLSSLSRVEQENNRYRFVVVVRNPYDSTMNGPGRTYTFKASIYMPPEI